MADPAVSNAGGEVALEAEGNKGTAMKAKINVIWEELNAKSSLAAKAGWPLAQKTSKANNPSKALPSWMVSLGLVPPRGTAVQKPSQGQGDELPKTTNETAGNGVVEGIQASIAQDEAQVKIKGSTAGSDLKVNEILSKLREGADTTTSSNSNALGDSKETEGDVQGLRRKTEMQASSSSGLDNLLQQISKKQKPNILDRSRKDWGQFKEVKGLEDELEAYKKSGDKYLDKVAFLQRADVREYEKERDARLALQSKQRAETAPLN